MQIFFFFSKQFFVREKLLIGAEEENKADFGGSRDQKIPIQKTSSFKGINILFDLTHFFLIIDLTHLKNKIEILNIKIEWILIDEIIDSLSSFVLA
jgi:hypothetical protein